jgi:hypothetical protein
MFQFLAGSFSRPVLHLLGKAAIYAYVLDAVNFLEVVFFRETELLISLGLIRILYSIIQFVS